jgi:hypothetical protein
MIPLRRKLAIQKVLPAAGPVPILKENRRTKMLALCNLPKAAEANTEVTSNRFESWI